MVGFLHDPPVHQTGPRHAGRFDRASLVVGLSGTIFARNKELSPAAQMPRDTPTTRTLRCAQRSRRYGASTPPHMAASSGDGSGPEVDGFGSWSCTFPPPPMPAFS